MGIEYAQAGDGLAVMTASYSAGVITQTGTDTTLSILSGLTGVTVVTIGIQSVYIIDNVTDLTSNGTWSWNPQIECLMSENGSNGCFDISGSVTIGQVVGFNPDGSTRYSKGIGLIMAGEGTSPTTERMKVLAGGSLTLLGGEVHSAQVIGQRTTGTIDCTETILVNISASNPHQLLRAEGDANAVSVTRAIYDGRDTPARIFAQNGINTWSGELRNAELQTRSGSHTDAMLVRDLSVAANYNTQDVVFFGLSTVDWAQAMEATNVDRGTGIRLALDDSTRDGHIAIFQEVQINVKDAALNNIQDCKIYIPTTDSGNRVNSTRSDALGKFQNNRDFSGSTFDVYTDTTDVNGDSSLLTILTGRFWNDDGTTVFQEDLYTVSQTPGTDTIKFIFASYLHNPTVQTYDIKSNAVFEVEQIIATDATLAETDDAVVAAYSTLDTARQVYDRAKLEWYNAHAGEESVTLTRSGDQVELGALTLVIDPTAAVYDLTGSTVTIKSSIFTSGATATTGGVTVRNGGLLQGGQFDCDIDYQGGAGTTLTNVNCTGVLNFDTAGTYNLVGCTLSEVTNSSGGAVILTTDINTTVTTNTGPNVTVNPPEVTVSVTCKDANDLTNISGARVFLEADTGGDLPSGDSVTITRSGSTATVTHTAHGLSNGDEVNIRGANESEYNGIHTISGVTTNTYNYTVSGTPTTPATGTITSTAVILNGDTNGSGVLSISNFSYTSDQPVTGRARKGTAAPYYVNAAISGTITSNGFSQNTFMVPDQ